MMRGGVGGSALENSIKKKKRERDTGVYGGTTWMRRAINIMHFGIGMIYGIALVLFGIGST